MNPLSLIEKYYSRDTMRYAIFMMHSESVAKKAATIAENIAHLSPDRQFIYEAAMLHDIGIFLCDAPKIGCEGIEPYIKHGVLGRTLLEKEGYAHHALVCERHVGLGITKAMITKQDLPLPLRDMQPQSLEEKIICYADKFFSKSAKALTQAKSLQDIRIELAHYSSPEQLKTFEEWVDLFGKT